MSLNRRHLRELTVKVIYLSSFYEPVKQAESAGRFLSHMETIDEFIGDEKDYIPPVEGEDPGIILTDEEEEKLEEAKEEIYERVKKILALLPHIDKQLNEKSVGWPTSRMCKIDLAILRVAVFEMQEDAETPEKVAINEAVELAKKYGTTDSPKFINGVLAKFISEQK